MSEAVFQTTGQALHVSYLIMSVEAKQKAATREVLMRLIESVELPSARLRAWYKELQGQASGTVNFGGLTGDEVRAQCAMVTSWVKHHLPEPEMHVIHARFIPTETEEIGRDDEKKPIYRFYFSQPRVDAIQWLSQWIAPNFKDMNTFQLDHLVTKAFAERREVRRSFRDLPALAHGGNHMFYARRYPKVVAYLKELEEMAIRRLTNHFVETGLVEQYQESA